MFTIALVGTLSWVLKAPQNNVVKLGRKYPIESRFCHKEWMGALLINKSNYGEEPFSSVLRGALPEMEGFWEAFPCTQNYRPKTFLGPNYQGPMGSLWPILFALGK